MYKNATVYEFYKKTTDDWCGNYPNDTVKVKFIENMYPPHHKGQPMSRISVSGNDDFIMVYDCESPIEAYNKFIRLVSGKTIEILKLTKLGFKDDTDYINDANCNIRTYCIKTYVDTETGCQYLWSGNSNTSIVQRLDSTGEPNTVLDDKHIP